jgi:hypothetical protein
VEYDALAPLELPLGPRTQSMRNQLAAEVSSVLLWGGARCPPVLVVECWILMSGRTVYDPGFICGRCVAFSWVVSAHKWCSVAWFHLFPHPTLCFAADISGSRRRGGPGEGRDQQPVRAAVAH